MFTQILRIFSQIYLILKKQNSQIIIFNNSIIIYSYRFTINFMTNKLESWSKILNFKILKQNMSSNKLSEFFL